MARPSSSSSRSISRSVARRTLAAAAVFLAVGVPACAAGGAQGCALCDPAAFTGQSPATFQAAFDTSKGRFVVEVHREWAPVGADRFYNLVKGGFFDAVRFFRGIGGQLARLGMDGAPKDRGS